MKKLAVLLLLLTPAISVATTPQLDPFPDCWPCPSSDKGGDNLSTLPIELPAEFR